MTADIKIFRKNFSTIVLQCSSPTIERELSHYFSAFASNYRFMPLFKQGVWDGRLRFFTKDNELAAGLIEHVYKFARDGKYKVECTFDRDNNQLLKRDFDKFVELLDLKLNGVSITLHDYQYTSIFESINKKAMNVHISTAGGKSMVIYVISRFLTLQDKRVLIVCPTTQLCLQMKSDFESYGWVGNNTRMNFYGAINDTELIYEIEMADGSLVELKESQRVKLKDGTIKSVN